MNCLSKDQLSANQKLSKWKVGALFMEPGTGKTRVAVELINSVKSELVVYITPLQTIDSAKKEVEKWGGLISPCIYVGIESIQSSDRIFLNTITRVKESKNVFLIVDESIKIKNIEAKRTKRLLMLRDFSEYRLILNGTPITRNILDMWSQMEFLSPKILNMPYAQYKQTFCIYTEVTKRFGNRTITKEFIRGFENIDYLYSLIQNYVYECDLNLNISQSYSTINYTTSDEEKEEYNRLKSIYLDDETLDLKNNNIFIEMTQKMQHSYCCSDDKFRIVNELFKEISQERTIIFCKYVASKEKCLINFPNAKVLSFQKESFGLNLQQYNNTIYFDKTWDLALRLHSSRRTFRTGQEYDCRYFDLTGDLKLENLIDRNIGKKVDMVEYFKSKTKKNIINEL